MKKFTAILLAVVMVFALGASALAATNSIETSYPVGEGLGVSVDYDIEGMYLDGTDILNAAENGYYPFSFSLIVTDRTKVASVTVSNGGSFHWAYAQNADGSYVTDENGNYVESDTTNYGVVVLPTTSASTVTVAGTDNIGSATFNCAKPCGGSSAAGANVYAYLPAPAQFVNEGVTSGGWGDIYDSTGKLKGNATTGVSLGFFGGYVVYEFNTPIADDPTHPYGADFIVYGNAFWNNSEAGCIQVSQNGTDWYDIAGSMYYTKSTPGASITFTNPNLNEDEVGTEDNPVEAGDAGKLADVDYTLKVGTSTTTGKVTKNTFHNHSWFPMYVNYFTDSGSRKAMDKISTLPFVSKTTRANGVANTLTFTGTLLTNYPGTGKTAEIGFGYCDVHPNKTLGGTIAYNPYQTFTSSSDYDTKVAGTSGGDPIDIAWAVDSNGAPAKLTSVKYVRIYTGMAQMNGIFGEISTEVCGVAACDTITGTGAAQTAPTVTIAVGEKSYTIDMTGKNLQTVTDAALKAWAEEYEVSSYTITVTDVNASYIYINGVAVASGTAKEIAVPTGTGHVQIITQTGDRSPFLAVIEN